MSEMPYKYVQTIVSVDESDEIDEYLRINRIKNKREWIRETLLKEVRKGNDESLPLHT